MNSEQRKPEGQPADKTQQPEPSAGKEAGKAAADAFYQPPLIASILTMLLVNGSQDGGTFGSFEKQLEKGIALGKAAEQRGEHGAREYRKAVEAVHTFWSNEENRDLFDNAHLGIKMLLTNLANSPSVRWSDCKLVSHATLFDIFTLPSR